jgi:hypothetical protein
MTSRPSPHASPEPLGSRAVLDVPFEEVPEAKRHGAQWDPVREEWWIARRDLVANVGIHRFIANKKLAREVKAAQAFQRRHPKLFRH